VTEPDRGEPGSLWRRNAAALLDEIVAHDDEHGALANAVGDELRDALRLSPRGPRPQGGDLRRRPAPGRRGLA
jgi:hypothetical protein